MAEQPLKGLRVAILATDGVEKVELTLPRLSLAEAGADTVLLAPKPQIQSMKHDEKDDRFAADMLLRDAQPEEFDAVMLPGGALNANPILPKKNLTTSISTNVRPKVSSSGSYSLRV